MAEKGQSRFRVHQINMAYKNIIRKLQVSLLIVIISLVFFVSMEILSCPHHLSGEG